MTDFKYPSSEKLKKKSEIDLLFSSGKWTSVEKMRIITLKNSEKHRIEHQRFGVSVSKKFFKKAVDRNRGKRLLREVYRLNKDLYRKAFGERSFAMLFWISKELPQNYKEAEEEFVKLCCKKIK